MASKKELAQLLKKQVKVTAGTGQETPSEASKTVIKVKPIRTVPPPAKKLRIEEPSAPVTSPAPAPSKDKGKGVAAAGNEGVVVGAGSYASPTFTGVGLPLPVPPMLDSRLLDDEKSAYLNQFPAATLFKQLKGMAVFTATVLKHFESGKAWEEAMKVEKLRLKAMAEHRVGEMKASFDRDLAETKKSKEDAETKANEAALARDEEAAKVASLKEELAAAKEEARVAREKLAKVEEDLAAKVAEVAAGEVVRDQLRQAITSTWDNAQEQVLLAYPGLDLSFMAVDAYVEEGDLWCCDDAGEVQRVPFPKSG